LQLDDPAARRMGKAQERALVGCMSLIQRELLAPPMDAEMIDCGETTR
jgi:hypothetical protein